MRTPARKGGEWKRHQYRTVELVGEFVSDCGEWTVDVNHDGAPDVVTVGWMTDGLWWYENPKKPGVMWQRHLIAHTFETEGGWMADINGDGKPDLALAHYGHAGVLWVDFAGPQPKVHYVGTRDQDGHGIGMADVDGDGKVDILMPHGWFKNIDADHDKWEWHPEWNLGETGFPIIGYDVNNDGKMDLIYGRGHSYGLYWLEQQGDAANRRWVKHTIDESFSQVHTLALADIDGDGEMELLAGKRYRGHYGGDPGSYEPLVVYYYKINRKTGEFTRYPHLRERHGRRRHAIHHRRSRWRRRYRPRHRRQNRRALLRKPQNQQSPEGATRKANPAQHNWPFPGEGPTVTQEEEPEQKK